MRNYKAKVALPRRLGTSYAYRESGTNESVRNDLLSRPLVRIYMLTMVIVSVVMLLIQMQVLDNHIIEVSSEAVHGAFAPHSAHAIRAERMKNKNSTGVASNNGTRIDNDDNLDCESIDDADEDDDLKPILKILCRGGYDVSKIDRSILPKWSKITEFYGPPKILGLDTCPKFREKVAELKNRNIAAAGIFNSGTNLVANLIENNCDFGSTKMKRRFFWQVPWGKHIPVEFRANHSGYQKGLENQKYDHTLPVVSVRDPYTWLQSMCRQPYAAQYAHGKDSCPNIVPYESDIEEHPRFKNMKYIPVHVKYSKEIRIKYESTAHMWNNWYSGYIQFENSTVGANVATTMKPQAFPFLLVRMEDLVFHAETVVPQMCECVGAKAADELYQPSRVVNLNSGIDKVGGLLKSIVKYGNTTKRRDGYATFQLEAAKDVLDSRLMNLLGYRYEEP